MLIAFVTSTLGKFSVLGPWLGCGSAGVQDADVRISKIADHIT